MTPESLAALHALCFADAPPPWSAASFARALAHPGARLVTEEAGFALAQVAGPEAELLTIAVDPARRREGRAGALLAALLGQLAAEGVEEIFLEVAAPNAAARALYARAGFTERGLRRGYYRRRGAEALDALVLGRPLSGAAPGPLGAGARGPAEKI